MRALLILLGIISPRILVVNSEAIDVDKLRKKLGTSFVLVPFSGTSYAQETIMEVK